jgi:hypothetical protein
MKKKLYTLRPRKNEHIPPIEIKIDSIHSRSYSNPQNFDEIEQTT